MNTKERTLVPVLMGDLLEEILSRLSVRDLLRLRSVCKSWCACIDDWTFMKKQYEFQYNKSANGNVPILLGRNINQPYVYLLTDSKQLQQGEDVVFDLTHDLHRDGEHLSGFFRSLCVKGVVNGIVLLAGYDKYLNKLESIWNPATREFKVVPVPEWLTEENKPFRSDAAHMYGFGFDVVSNDFKIVAFVRKRGYELYSLNTNTWKKLEGPSVRPDGSYTDSYLNGVYYWGADMYDGQDRQAVIMSFNFRTEVFKLCDPPKQASRDLEDENFGIGRKIALCKNSLAWIVKRHGECLFDIWVVTKFDDHGVPLSWQHESTVGPVPPIHGLLCFQAFRMDGDMLFSSLKDVDDDYYNLFDEKLIIYNPSTNAVKNLEIGCDTSFRYIESLFPLSTRLA